MQILILPEQKAQLLANGLRRHAADFDPEPVVKLFTPDGAATWLLTDLDPDDPDIAFGLCDLGMGFPELGTVSISELKALRGRFGLPVERDEWFRAKGPVSQYLEDALAAGRVTA